MAYMFGLGQGHLKGAARTAAVRAGAEVRNITEQCKCGRGHNYGECPKSRRHWLEIPNYGSGFNECKAAEVMAAIAHARA